MSETIVLGGCENCAGDIIKYEWRRDYTDDALIYDTIWECNNCRMGGIIDNDE